LQGKVATFIGCSGLSLYCSLLVSAYFIDVAWQKLWQCILIFHVIRQNIVVTFPEAVRDNVVSNDVMITSSLRIDVIKVGKKFLFSQ